MAEKANRVWHSGRLFARIRAEKGGNRKRKRDTVHVGVGSSGAGGAIQALLRQCLNGCRKSQAEMLGFFDSLIMRSTRGFD